LPDTTTVYVSFPDENTPVEEYEMQPTIKMAIVEQKHKNSTFNILIPICWIAGEASDFFKL